ncbi:MAG: tRNA (adenosine(37)-N6)-dimethylallyltransferase MiaA [Thermoguttaceae bacterium]|nr:tRNA (adenosine(37)-N6)-dimethylallyltransferase MiaA [Thermoguttaceae bacterium]
MSVESQEFRVIPRVTNCWFLTGPTASGKTRLGVELAQRLDAEIISLDSMAVYRHMNIGTAKPTLQERCGITHHMIDVVDPSNDFSLAAYVTLASCAVADIHARKKRVLFVGGTPLYLKGMIRGIFDGPGSDPLFRSETEQRCQLNGTSTLHHELEQIDPETALRLHPNDKRRIIRALEVFEKTGKPISFFQKQFDSPASRDEVRVFVLDWNRELLYERINRRVDIMMNDGFLNEVKQLLARPQPLGKTASQAVGYRELIAHLRLEMSLDDAIARTKQLSRNFAKSQGTWFRSLSECEYVAVGPDTDWNALADSLAATA